MFASRTRESGLIGYRNNVSTGSFGHVFDASIVKLVGDQKLVQLKPVLRSSQIRSRDDFSEFSFEVRFKLFGDVCSREINHFNY